MKQVRTGDLVFAHAYRGETSTGILGVVCRVYQKNGEHGWDMASVWTAEGFELVPVISCRIICSKK